MAVLAVIVAIVLIALTNRADRAGERVAEPSTAPVDVGMTPEQQPSLAVASGVTPDGDHYLGSPDAPVKVIEYSDFFCGHCGNFAAEKAPQIEQTYIATGQVQWIVPYYALGKDARLAVVEATACAGDQGRFFEYRRLLFANQQVLGQTPPDQWQPLLMDFAKQVGLDLTVFASCWDQGLHQTEILASIDQAWQAGMTSTPRFLINGQLIVGNQPYEVFEKAIEDALAADR